MFVLNHDGICHDFDLELLRKLLVPIDSQLTELIPEARSNPLAEELGYGDWIDELAGLGFAACQQYINATYPQLVGSTRSHTRQHRAGVWAKEAHRRALEAGKAGSSGHSIAEVINAAANYWKHFDEWELQQSRAGLELNEVPAPSRRETQTRRVLETVVAQSEQYSLSEVLSKLVAPAEPRFDCLVPSVVAWRDAAWTELRVSRGGD